MKKVTLAIAMAALVIFAGCKKDKEITGTTLKASIEQYKSGDSKTSIVPVGSEAEIRWTTGDKIVVNNGTTSGTFTLTGGAGLTTGTFTYNGEYTLGDNNIAVYPETATISGNTVTVTLPAVQTYVAASNGSTPMLGTFNDPEALTFTSLCGALGISLKAASDDVAITAIEVVSKTDEKLNGTFTANASDANPVLVHSADGTNSVRFNCDITLTSTEAQNFYFAMPVGALANGFTLNVYDGADPIFSTSTDNNITIELNQVNQMPEVSVALANVVDLSTLSESYTAQDGDIITGTANGSFSLRIPGDVSVTLRNVDCTEEFTIRCMDFEPGEHSVSINLEGNNSAWNFAQVVGIKNLTISGDGRLDLGNNMSFGPGCNTTIDGTTITGSLIYIGDDNSGEENTLTIDGGSVSINGGILANNDANINVETDGNLTVHVTKDDWFSTVFPGIEGSSGSEVNVTITDGVNGNSNLTIISYENSFTGDKFIKAQSINFGGTDVKEAWDAKTWSADGYQNFGPLRASYTASTKTLVLEPAPAPDYVFSVSNTTTVHFAPGNLQYKSGEGWRFAEHQYDYIGAWNATDWVDYFGWGTWGDGQNPLQTVKSSSSYHWSTDFQGTLNGHNDWYTLTKDEWNYLFTGRTNASSLYGHATVNGVHGIIVLPDASTLSINSTSHNWSANVIDATTWTNTYEADGAMFLPAAGQRYGTDVEDVNSYGYYWSSTTASGNNAYELLISSLIVSAASNTDNYYYGNSVRLARIVQQ